MKFEDRVRIYEYKLNDTDDQVVEFIRAHKDDVFNMSIGKMAEKLYTVPNTIMRLVRKLGYSGFSEFKLAVKKESEGIDEYSPHVPDTVIKTYDMMDMDKIEIVSKKLHHAEALHFYGVGSSIQLCKTMTKYLRVTKRRSQFYEHRHDLLYSADNVGPQDVVFAISVSGETDQVVEAATKAKENGAYLITLTHLSENTLASIADMNLYCWSPNRTLNDYNITDYTPLMLVLRKLLEHYWHLYG